MLIWKKWINERAWVFLRLPSGTMGQEGAKLTAGGVYNVFDAAYRSATLARQIPYYFVIVEAHGGRMWVDPPPGAGGNLFPQSTVEPLKK